MRTCRGNIQCHEKDCIEATSVGRSEMDKLMQGNSMAGDVTCGADTATMVGDDGT